MFSLLRLQFLLSFQEKSSLRFKFSWHVENIHSIIALLIQTSRKKNKNQEYNNKKNDQSPKKKNKRNNPGFLCWSAGTQVQIEKERILVAWSRYYFVANIEYNTVEKKIKQKHRWKHKNNRLKCQRASFAFLEDPFSAFIAVIFLFYIFFICFGHCWCNLCIMHSIEIFKNKCMKNIFPYFYPLEAMYLIRRK